MRLHLQQYSWRLNPRSRLTIASKFDRFILLRLNLSPFFDGFPPMPRPETLLATLPGESDRERVMVVMVVTASGSQVEIRQQSWGDGLGWFTQSTVQLEPEQIGGLRQALGLGGSLGKVRMSAFPAEPRRAGGFVPRVVHADSA
jgi:hypothetical protein